MTGFVVVGTDTDVGKTGFCALLLSAFSKDLAYWKPVETGVSDTDTIRRLVPEAKVYQPLASFAEPIAPMLAASREGRVMPGVEDILGAIPNDGRPLLFETFGSSFSPLTADALQVELIAALGWPIVLVDSARVGAVGRTLQAVSAMAAYGLKAAAVVLASHCRLSLRERTLFRGANEDTVDASHDDSFALELIAKHVPETCVVGLELPAGKWSVESIAEASVGQIEQLNEIRDALSAFTTLESSSRYGVQASRERERPEVVTPVADAPGSSGFSNIEPFPQIRGDGLIARDRAVIWHPYTSLKSEETLLPVISAENEFLTLADGRQIIDGISSWWTILHGHRHPKIMAAIRAATQTLDHVLFAGATHPHAVELAEALLSSLPWAKGGRVFYSDNGSTAVEIALKIAYQFFCHRGEPERSLFVGFENGYHGDTFGAMAVGRDPLFFGRFEPLLFQTLQVPVSVDALDAALAKNAGRVAAVIMEPLVQGAGGMRMHSAEVLRGLFEVAKRHGVLFIADEVMTGFGRTGTLWAHEQATIAPDLLCCAKGITGGVLPLAATIASPEIVASFDIVDRTKTLFHGHSFTGNPLTCAAAVASWRVVHETPIQAKVARIEQFWRTHLAGMHFVRILGSIAAIELNIPGGYLAEQGAHMRRVALEHGVLLRPLGNVIYAMPPLCASDESLTRIVASMAAAVKACGM